jgi:hypothetical protein
MFAISLEMIALVCSFDDTGTYDRHALRVDEALSARIVWFVFVEEIHDIP